MSRKTVFFDLGSTLFGHADLCGVMAEKLTDDGDDSLIREIVLDAITTTRLGITPRNFSTIKELTRDVLAGLCRDYGHPDISNEAGHLCRDVYGHRSFLYPEAISVLDQLSTHGVELIAASDNDDDILEIQMEKHGLAGYFSGWYISERLKCYKPSDEYVGYLRKHTGGREEDCYFIGDARWDVQCGQKLGITTVHINRDGSGDIHEADFVISDLTGLPSILGI
jgi:2-haloalkanoic acid dehalogenase type II